MFKKRLSKKAAVPITSGRQRRGSDPVAGSGGLLALANGSKTRRPSSTTPGATMPPKASVDMADVTSTDEIDGHYYHGLEANTQVQMMPATSVSRIVLCVSAGV